MDVTKSKAALKAASPYSAAITREQFLFYEMRIIAKMRTEGMEDKKILDRVINDNLFQYPTEKSNKRMALACFRRLDCLNDDTLVEAIANQPSDVAKQICLFAMMKQNRLIWDFMITVIGEKYRVLDMTFTRRDLNMFFMRLQEQDDWVAEWSESTISKLKQILLKLLVDNEYLDNIKSETLRPVLISSILENSIRASGETQALIAFNCFS